jgi:excisionase family DNA binding protein
MISLIGQYQGQKARTYIPVKEASKLIGYSNQYLRRLLRQEKLQGIKVGQVWLLEVISIDAYLALLNRALDRRCGPRTKGMKSFRTH